MLSLSLRNPIGDFYPERGVYSARPIPSLLESLFGESVSDYGPRYELNDTEGGDFQLTLPLPGFKRDEVSIEIENRTLSISAKNAKHSISRSLDLLEAIDTEAIGAVLEDGLLTVTLGRHAVSKPRKIAIK